MSGAADWAALMRLGLGRLRLSPAVFWDMSPAELAAAAGWAGEAAAGRAALSRLMAAYPDERGRDDR